MMATTLLPLRPSYCDGDDGCCAADSVSICQMNRRVDDYCDGDCCDVWMTVVL